MKPVHAEIRALTGVRAVAAGWVLLTHLTVELNAVGAGPAIAWFAQAGYLGVDLFFILSGFIISYVYAGNFKRFSATTYATFLRARIARMYPVHLATLFGLLALVVGGPALGIQIAGLERFTGPDFITNLLLVQAWSFPALLSWNAVAWSISAEWLAYLAFPVFAWLSARVQSPKVGIPIILACLISLTALGAVVTFGDSTAYALPRIATEFLVGCILYRFYVQRLGERLPWGAIAPLAGLAAIVVAGLGVSAGGWGFSAVPLLALLIYALSWERGALAAALQGKVAHYWGRVSFSLYMTHSIVLLVLRKAIPLGGHSLAVEVALLVTYLVVIGATAALTYHFIEEPGRRFLRKAGTRSPIKAARGVSSDDPVVPPVLPVELPHRSAGGE